MRRLGAGVAAIALTLLLASPASAAFEQTGIFAGSLTPPSKPGVFPEEVQLGGVGGLAVNYTGAGGVPAGTVYAASLTNATGLRIARYTPSGTGLEFIEAWQVRLVEGEYERCGPLVAKEEEAEGKVPAHPHCPAIAASGPGHVDVDIDQSTGNVYVLNEEALDPEFLTMAVFTPDGSNLISRFGQPIAGSKTIAESPDRIHDTLGPAEMAVGGSGKVYIFDFINGGKFEHRLMVFKPQSTGDYEHYVYAGQQADLGVGAFGEGEPPTHPVADMVGNIYVSGDAYVEKYDPTHPSDPPICSFTYSKGGIVAIAVNSVTGEVFFYTYKDKRVHRLSPCDGGEFHEVESFAVAPERDYLDALAFDPARQLEASRAPGVLYGGAPSAQPGVGKGEPGQSSLGYIFSHVKELSPVVESESVANVTATTATLGAQINPKGSATRYAFQYITQAQYEENEPTDSFAGATEAPLGGATLAGNGQQGVGASIALASLAPDTAYRYRALATSHCSSSEPAKICEGAGADQLLHTFPAEAPKLPDNRAWELASPSLKNGGQVFPAEPTVASGNCGNLECKPGAANQRFPMQSSPDGEAIVYEGSPFSPSEGAVIENQYIAHRDPKAGWQTTNLTPPLLQSKAGQGYKAFNAALSEGILEQLNPSLTPEAPSEYANLYLQPTASPLSLDPLLASEPPNRLPGNVSNSLSLSYAGASADFSRHFFEANDALTEATPFAPEAIDGGEHKKNLYEWAGGQLRLVNVLPGNTETTPGASFALASAHSISRGGSRFFWSSEAGQAYVRENGESTIAIPDPGKFLSASADGSEVLLNNGHLYDLETEAIADLTQGKGGFQGIAGQSEDLSRIYFVDTAVLSGENAEGKSPLEGKYNLYGWNEGTTVFIATLLEGDNANNDGDWAANPAKRSAEASPAGRRLAFRSQARLTGYDNIGPCFVENGTEKVIDGPCAEVFLYDSAMGRLSCPSCNPSGSRPLGSSTLLRITKAVSGSIPQPRYLTDEGRLYFDSGDSLVPTDTNNGVEDVYEYEPEGIGSCKREVGCVSLISAGHGAVDSNLLAIDGTGKNVFFTSRDQLLLKDKDQLIDLYDAREDGGISSETEVARSECQGEACQPAITPPNHATPASSALAGDGNVDEKKAKKHTKKRHPHKHKAKKHVKKRVANSNRGGGK